MRRPKEVLNNTNIVVKLVLYSLYNIGKLYGPALDHLTKQYTELKKEKKEEQKNPQQEEEIYIKRQKEIMKEALEVLSSPAPKPKKELVIKRITQKPNFQNFNTIAEILEEKLKPLVSEIEKMEIILYETPEFMELVPYESREQCLLKIIGPGREAECKNKSLDYKNGFLSTGFISFCVTLALNVYLNIGGINEFVKNRSMDISNSIKEDIEDVVTSVETYFSFKEVETPLMDRYKIQFAEIMQSSVSIESKIDKLLRLNATNYQNTFQAILEIPNASYEYKIDKIMHSELTDYRNIYRYLIGKEDLPKRTVIQAILNSDIASYQTNLEFILNESGLKQYESMEYIVSSHHTYEELFSFIINEKSFTSKEKVWYSLMIKDTSLSTIFKDLVNSSGMTINQVMKDMVEADMISFTTLFDTFLDSKLVTEEEIMETLVSYHSTFNEVSLEDKIDWCLKTNLKEDTKIDTVWELLESYTLTEKEKFILDYYGITDYHDFINLYKKNPNKLTLDEIRLLALNEKVNLEKEKYIIEHYEMESPQQLYSTIGGVCAESDRTYDDCYGVSTVFWNRITDKKYAQIGKNPYLQYIEPGQFAVRYFGIDEDFIHPKDEYHRQIFNIGRQSFLNVFYMPYEEDIYGEEKIKHDFIEFRCRTEKNFPAELQITPRGNIYGIHKRGEVIYEDLYMARDLLSEKDKEILSKGLILSKMEEK